MVDVKGWATLLIYGLGLLFLFQIASAPGLSGKVFVILVLAGYWWVVIRTQQEGKAPNALNIYFKRLKTLCRLNRSPMLRRLILTGDSANARLLKGEIIGGPVREINRTLPTNHPKLIKWIFLYTPDTSWIYTWPVIGWIMSNFRHEILFAVFHNPEARGENGEPGKSQLVPPNRMLSKSLSDRSYVFLGDIEVRGISTQYVREMEFVNDELFSIDEEMWKLANSVDVLTLEEMLANEPGRVRNAIDSNSVHMRLLDLKDIPMGSAKSGEAS